MKPDTPEIFRTIQLLIGTIALTMLSPASPGQQVVPGAVALEAEEEVVRRYSVELIIFEYVDNTTAGTEIFDPDEPPAPAAEELLYGDARLDPAIEMDALTIDPLDTEPLVSEETVTDDALFADDTDVLLPPIEEVIIEEIRTYEQAGVKFLGPEDYILNDEYERLVLLDAYRPLMRAAWTQPTIEKDVTMPIALRRLGDPPLRLDGTMKLYLSRFLHLVVDLELEDRTTKQPSLARDRSRRYGDDRTRFSFDTDFIAPSTYYRIEEDRIVRNGELRYYDHPRFGVLAKITRVEENQAGEDDADIALIRGGQN